MRNDELIKQIVFGIMDGKNKTGRQKMNGRPGKLMQQIHWHLVQNGDGQDGLESFHEICHSLLNRKRD